MIIFKKLVFIFVVSFILNVVWENAHVFLYMHYKGGVITERILLHATLIDALIISAISLPFLFGAFKKYTWVIAMLGIIIAVLIEWWALGTSRWAYNSYMPIVPFIGVGFTPFIQLGLLGYISYLLEEHFFAKRV